MFLEETVMHFFYDYNMIIYSTELLFTSIWK